MPDDHRPETPPNSRLETLKRIADSVGERRGWDFSSLREDRDPVPWDYGEVVRRYLRPTSRVLDIGTGGGERFLALAGDFGSGVGIDSSPQMIQTARENTPPELAGKVSFQVQRAEALKFPDACFDLVLNRHAPVYTLEIVRVLCPDGVFITQQVGARNTRNITTVFDCGVDGVYAENPEQDEEPPDRESLAESFRSYGCEVVATGEYDVRYFFRDVESFIFWLKAIPMPEDFDMEMHGRQVAQIIDRYTTPRGIQTNEHRELLIVRKAWG